VHELAVLVDVTVSAREAVGVLVNVVVVVVGVIVLVGVLHHAMPMRVLVR
jgi:hypothetical protein